MHTERERERERERDKKKKKWILFYDISIELMGPADVDGSI